jgi:hypothetical protein
LIAAKNNFLTLKLYKDTLRGYNFIMMEKYVCLMGCIKPQDQPGNCLECGMKLLPADERGSMRMMDYADKCRLNKTQINVDKNISVNSWDNDLRKSEYESNNISVD